MTSLRPIEIVGGGLAGLSLGIALRRAGAPVVVHEAGTYPRHRVCGEFIAGLDPVTRRELRLDPILSDVRFHQEVAWCRDGLPFHRQPLPSTAFAISRHRLDHRLAETFVNVGGDLRTHSRIADFGPVVGRVHAHGRRPSPESPWLGLKAHVRGLRLSAPLELHLGARAYVGLCLVERDTVNICGLFPRHPHLGVDRSSALVAHLRASRLDELADRLAGAEIDPASHCAVSALAFGRSPEPAGDGTNSPRLALGDAHAFVPPFTGNGMAMAFQSAATALPHLLAYARGEHTWGETVARVREKLRGRFRLRLAGAAFLHRAILAPVAQATLHAGSRLGLVPFASLYHATH